MGQVTECAVCGKEIKWDQELFVKGEHGEPVCSECEEEK